MPRLSVVIIARDEADRIGDALRSVSFADEILVLDSGSRDGTPEVAEAGGARVLRTDWPGHVAQKNRGLAEAAGEWVLSIDADERVSDELADSIRVALAVPPRAEGFRGRRRNHYLGRALVGGRWYPDTRVRLVRKGSARWTGKDPHDLLRVDGLVRDLDGDLLHHPYRDLGEHLATLDRYSARFVETAGEVRAAWWDLVFRPPWAFFRAYILERGYRDGALGLLLAGLGATHTLLKWTRLRLADPGARSRGTGGLAAPR
jgi:glycosyltransferase involved in cell wall biosynthesis